MARYLHSNYSIANPSYLEGIHFTKLNSDTNPPCLLLVGDFNVRVNLESFDKLILVNQRNEDFSLPLNIDLHNHPLQ